MPYAAVEWHKPVIFIHWEILNELIITYRVGEWKDRRRKRRSYRKKKNRVQQHVLLFIGNLQHSMVFSFCTPVQFISLGKIFFFFFPSNSILSIVCEVKQILLTGVYSDEIANIALLTPLMQEKQFSIVQADSNTTQNFPPGTDRTLTTKAL